jgi:hypothetical protein
MPHALSDIMMPHALSDIHIMADMICHKVYELLMSILSGFTLQMLLFRKLK